MRGILRPRRRRGFFLSSDVVSLANLRHLAPGLIRNTIYDVEYWTTFVPHSPYMLTLLVVFTSALVLLFARHRINAGPSGRFAIGVFIVGTFS